ncbi:MAG: anti-sigma factor family protein [Fimbriimonas sp.]
MSPDKARDLFSSYYDGTLEGGLHQALERSFSQDDRLRADYESFRATMAHLEVLAEESIEVPSYLSDRIATRLEAARDSKKASIFSPLWLRNLAFGGLAATALVASVLTFNQIGRGATAGTGMADVLELKLKDGAVVVDYVAQAKHSVKISTDGTVVDQQELDRQRLLTTLTNKQNPGPVIFKIEASGISDPIFVAVPGSKKLTKRDGEGTLQDLAKAISGFYQIPVRIDSKRTEKLKWNFESADLGDLSSKLQSEQGVSADLMATGLVSLR